MQTKSCSRETHPSFRAALGLLSFAVASFSAQATVYCVTAGDVQGLQNAMSDASINGQSDEIRLQGGFYSISANFLLSYGPTAADQGGDLTITGGYGPTIGDDCGLAPSVPDASATVLEGGLWRTRLSPAGGSIGLTALTLQSTFSADPVHATIELSADPNAPGNIDIENVKFVDNSAIATSAIYVMAGQGGVIVRNSLFASTVSLSAGSPIQMGSSAVGSFCVGILNSTFAATASNSAALDVSAANCPVIVANDIFWNNTQGGDLVFDHPQSAYLFSVDLADVGEAANTNATDLYTYNPLFNADFSLTDFSPLRDRGTASSGIPIGNYDVVGLPRVYHDERPDIGAFEIQDVIMAYDFDVDMHANL